jgi:hypothetical protein
LLNSDVFVRALGTVRHVSHVREVVTLDVAGMTNSNIVPDSVPDGLQLFVVVI